MDPSALLAGALALAAGALLLAFTLALGRLIRGPHLPDRVVALDTIGYVAVGLIAVGAVRTGVPALLDAAVLLGLVTFVATVALARRVGGPPAPRA